MRPTLRVLGGVALGLVAALLLSGSEPAPEVENVLDPTVTVHERTFTVDDGTDGAIVQAILRQAPHKAGPSGDVIRLTWDQPVQILGVLVSVDISPNVALTEVSAGIGWDNYQGNTTGALIHTSNLGGGKIDESVWFGDLGPTVEPGEWVMVTAWLQNRTDSERGVSPEVIVWYRPDDS